LSKGVEASRALRNVQLLMLHSPDGGLRTPRVWASMQLVGVD